MGKSKTIITSGIFISKAPGYKEHKVILAGIDKDRESEFNAGEKIEVTAEELNAIGEHRWLIKENKNGN